MRAVPRGLLPAVLVALGLVPRTVQAQEPQRLQVHASFTQGFVRTDTLTVLGINSATSADYRTAALNLAYELTELDRLVLQVSHRRLGMSPLMQAESSVEVDWALYQRAIGPLQARIGRLPLPSGIYGEVRDAGTTLPFYRAPASVYEEGFENLDGLSLAGGVQRGEWSAQLTAYYGGMRGFDASASAAGPVLVRVGMRHLAGGRLWLNTPLHGLRAGVSAARYDAYLGRPVKNDGRTLTASLDLSRERLLARAEFQLQRLEDVRTTRAWYAQGSVRAVGALWVGAQAEAADTELAGTAGAQETLRDYALGLRYLLSPQVVLKAEAHDRTGYEFDEFINPAADAAAARYAILALAVAF